MTKLEGGKVKITGVNPEMAQSRFDFRTSMQNADIERYFARVYVRQGAEWQPNTLYLGCTLSNEAPWLRIRSTQNFNEPNAFRPTSTRYSYHRIERSDRTHPEDGIMIKFNNNRAIMGYYWVGSKTLYIAGLDRSQDMVNLLEAVKSWLVINSSLRPLRERQEAAPVVVERRHCTVGCDPEFEVVRNGAVVSPGQGIDANAYISGGSRMSSEIGVDGAGRQIEIRPKYNLDPGKVVDYMRGILGRIHDKLSSIGDTYPVGGHIHLGVGRAIHPPQDLLWLLDAFIGKPTIDLSGSARSGYKRLSAYEIKEWGFEYRTPPAAIFDRPEIAKIAMKIAKYITEAFINCDEIVVDQKPCFMDYFKYARLTAKEWAAWTAWLEEYKKMLASPSAIKYSNNVVAFWLAPETKMAVDPNAQIPPAEEEEEIIAPQAAPRDPAVPIVFRDEWSVAQREIFREVLIPVVEEIRRSRSDFAIEIFGLAGHRGESVISGFSCLGCLRLDPAPREGFGIAYNIRMSPGLGELARRVALAIAACLREGVE